MWEPRWFKLVLFTKIILENIIKLHVNTDYSLICLCTYYASNEALDWFITLKIVIYCLWY